MKLLVVFSLFMMTSCASWTKSERIADVDKSLSDLRRAIQSSLPLGTRKVTEGGKHFESQYFIVGKKKFLKPLNAKKRYFADILIRGDRRPYSIEITVFKQTKVKSSKVALDSFKDNGTDERIANLIKRRIIKQLSKRREDLNIIDDFRVF